MLGLDDLQEAREVRLHELVEPAGVELLAQPRVAGDVEEEHRHFRRALLQHGGVGVALQELLDGVGDELRQLALELLEQRQPLPRFLKMLQRRGQLRVLALQLGVGAGQALRHVVEGGAHLAQLVAAGRGRARREVAAAHPPRRRRQRLQRAHDHRAHGHGEHGARRHDGEEADEDLAVAVALDLGEDGLHRGGHAHDRPHGVVGAVAALALLLVGDRMDEREVAGAVVRLQGFLALARLHGPREERPAHRRPRRPRHPGDGGQHAGGEPGRAVDLNGRREVGEGLHPVAPVDRELLHGRGGAQLLDDHAGDVGPLLEHGALDARHEGGRQAPRGHLLLLHEQLGLALQRHHGGGAEADDEDGDDEQGELDGQAGADQQGPPRHGRVLRR
ncbi:MAG TPA: hypothetical protein VFX28_14230 [Methylomirabilota bacterium]|nr:hypothetical protein [Methylomirabilota bacterium]